MLRLVVVRDRSELTHKAEVDISSELHAILEVARYPANHQQQQSPLHILMTKDLRSYAG